ncbi:MAG TPA: FHA domain-containing protein [Gaiellaceae bacterium]|nr:FHA domain-containing protein [Gaiellaceae bacterium]
MSPTVVASTRLAEVLLALKIAFLVLLYLFIWRIVRTAARELRAPHEDSMILSPAAAAKAGLGAAAAPSARSARLVVEQSPSFEAGDAFLVDSAPLTIGRAGENQIVLAGDEFASAQHARVEARRGGVWVHDLGSTNGTFVNGERVVGAQRLSPGDVLRVGATNLRLEA